MSHKGRRNTGRGTPVASHRNVCMHITVSVDKSEQYIVDWGGGRELGPCPPPPNHGNRWFVSSIYCFPWDSLAGDKPEQLKQPLLCKRVKGPWVPSVSQEGDMWKETRLLKWSRGGFGCWPLASSGDRPVPGASWLSSCRGTVGASPLSFLL